MEAAAARAANIATRAISSNTFINICLVGSFLMLSVRSVKQQKDIEALEAQKESLIKSNKAMKKAMWDWKQQLFAEASFPDSAIVPLDRLKAIYGDVVTAAPAGATAEESGKLPATKIMMKEVETVATKSP
ncbi:hypothetical protein Dimus_024647 [Dionaea muscipula]